MTKEQLAKFYELETSLHKKETRNSRERVSALIADDFLEFGKSGGILTKRETLENLKDEAVDWQVEVSDFAAGSCRLVWFSSPTRPQCSMKTTPRPSRLTGAQSGYCGSAGGRWCSTKVRKGARPPSMPRTAAGREHHHTHRSAAPTIPIGRHQKQPVIARILRTLTTTDARLTPAWKSRVSADPSAKLQHLRLVSTPQRSAVSRTHERRRTSGTSTDDNGCDREERLRRTIRSLV
jgi:hypothetical protein